jgi:hypothetical protein
LASKWPRGAVCASGVSQNELKTENHRTRKGPFRCLTADRDDPGDGSDEGPEEKRRQPPPHRRGPTLTPVKGPFRLHASRARTGKTRHWLKLLWATPGHFEHAARQ